ncbi:sensor histidine kinase [Kribbella monticola]|uniref:sensor histidine kinase n=1 Tax=Kribbella monticola TaxID=2185285 RepID=UPI000DD41072|nr:histidine kinase [Kribbella monticola]
MAMLVSPRRPGWLVNHPGANDAVLIGALMAAVVAKPGGNPDGAIGLSPLVVVLAVIACSALALRRQQPLLALGITTGAYCLYVLLLATKSPIGLPMAIAIYTVVLTFDRGRRILPICLVTVAGVACTTIATHFAVWENLPVLAIIGLSVAIGEAMRNRRAYLAEIQERIRRVEQSREEEAERRVMEERIRIAHELHDVIAHHIALMNVQAGVAAHMLREQPEESERALALVREGGRTVLQELTVLLGVLRKTGDSSTPTAPSPSLDQVGSLIESFAAAGLQVEWQPAEQPSAELPELVGLTAYRVVQESLTNVVKHTTDARVTVRINQSRAVLDVEVTNTPGSPGPASSGGSGHGLIGMRERVATVGGTVTAGPTPEGGFRVHAVLPLLEGVVDDDPGAAGGRPDLDPQGVPGSRRLGG